ncbi:MAG: FAD-dependent oxidoreductase [Chloroflexi bacterium]|nr:FAD-dependent oxidoreductase [Chloroflexota bacterium]
MNKHPVAIIGGGPVGLAAAAHLLERGERAILFEAGSTVGASVLDWGHARMFSPWQFNMDAACVRLLEAAGWTAPPPEELPTGAELYERYLRPLAELAIMQDIIHSRARVIAVSRRYHDKMKDRARDDAPFVLRVALADDSESQFLARAVIDASGTWQNPNPAGADGLPALGESRSVVHQTRGQHQRIWYGIPDVKRGARDRYLGKRVMVVGSGHSAINTLLDLARLAEDEPKTSIVWALRSANLQRVYGGGENDALPARGQLGVLMRRAVAAGAMEILAPYRISKIEDHGDALVISGDLDGAFHSAEVEELIICTGARPDLGITRELRLDLDPVVESSRALAPLIDPNLHSCGTVRPHGEAELRQPEKDFYIVGMKSYGRAPTFLMATGYEQARSVVAALTGDWDAARDVQLNLPETGVCAADYQDATPCCDPIAVDCCAPAPITLEDIPLASAIPQVPAGIIDNE